MATNNVLVIAEHREGSLRRATFEILGEASRLAEGLGGSVEAVVVGAGVTEMAAPLAHHGAEKVYVADDPALDTHSSDGYASVLASVVEEAEPAVVLGSASFPGRDLVPRVAAKLEAGLASECTGFELDGDGRVLMHRPMYAGKAIATVQVNTAPQMATVRPNTFATAEADKSREPTVQEVTLDGYEAQAVVTGFEATGGETLDVSEADIIISGGRGMGSPENYDILEELAGVLPNAAVGASRAAVDAGWRPHADQVGQTGKTVSPSLYIACGISGAVQHLAGMKTSKYIVAINTDPEAPIFDVADYGIVADLFEVVPVLTEEFERLLLEE